MHIEVLDHSKTLEMGSEQWYSRVACQTLLESSTLPEWQIQGCNASATHWKKPHRPCQQVKIDIWQSVSIRVNVSSEAFLIASSTLDIDNPPLLKYRNEISSRDSSFGISKRDFAESSKNSLIPVHCHNYRFNMLQILSMRLIWSRSA
jgi:hypothetical protein